MGSCRARSVYLTTRLLGRQSAKRLTSILHILSPETDNCPSWISGRERMTVENISWSTYTTDTTQSTTDPVLVLHIRHGTQLPSTSPTYSIQYCTVPLPVLVIRYSPPLSRNQFYIYDTVHNCPSTNPTDTLQSTTVPLPVLHIRYRPSTSPQLPKYQSIWYDTVHYFSGTSPTYTIQYTTAQGPVPPIQHSPLLSQYYMYDRVCCCPITSPTDEIVHYCPITNPFDTTLYTTAKEQVLLIRQSTLLPHTAEYTTTPDQS